MQTLKHTQETTIKVKRTKYVSKYKYNSMLFEFLGRLNADLGDLPLTEATDLIDTFEAFVAEAEKYIVEENAK